MYQRILIPIDGSPCSGAVIRTGLELARLAAADVSFLFVTEDPTVTVYGVTYGEKMRSGQHGAADAVLERALAQAEAAAVPAQALRIDDAHPAEAILAQEAGADLVVMGTHGRRGVRRMMMGSVTEEVLRRSDKPHLTVRCPAADIGAVDIGAGDIGAGDIGAGDIGAG